MTGKPSQKEEEYIFKQEMKKLQKAAQEEAEKQAEKEKEQLKELHWMRCPKCGMELKEISFRNVNVDKCFSCGGVWLDDGELEQLAGKESEGFMSCLFNVFKSE